MWMVRLVCALYLLIVTCSSVVPPVDQKETDDLGNLTLSNSDIFNISLFANGTNATDAPDGYEPPSTHYCGKKFRDFRNVFANIHGYFSAVVCVFGTLANILNIIVLTRKDMVSPTNAILTGLAVADMLVMLEYLPFTIHFYINKHQRPEDMYTYGWTVFVLFHAHFSVIFHTISIALTITLAVWRYIAVCVPQNNRAWCNMDRAKIAIISCYVFSPLFCIPVYLAFSIISRIYARSNGTDILVYEVNQSEIARAHNNLLSKLNFWIYSVIIKLVPCVALTILSYCLIQALDEAQKRRIMLRQRADDRSCDRTTRMLLAVLALFLITEFPQGILGLLSAILGDDFFYSCYMHMSEVMDIFALINSAVNFILYCVMSRQFRQTFSHLFFKVKILSNWVALPTSEPSTQATTYV